MWPVLYSLSTVPNVPGISRLQRDMNQWKNACCKHLTIMASSKKERKEEKATYRVNMFAVPRWPLPASHWSHRLTGHTVSLVTLSTAGRQRPQRRDWRFPRRAVGPDSQLRLQPQPRPAQHLHGCRYGPAGLQLSLRNVRKLLSAFQSRQNSPRDKQNVFLPVKAVLTANQRRLVTDAGN